jgi:hypothetical protein
VSGGGDAKVEELGAQGASAREKGSERKTKSKPALDMQF